jgi:hypothetical protein
MKAPRKAAPGRVPTPAGDRPEPRKPRSAAPGAEATPKAPDTRAAEEAGESGLPDEVLELVSAIDEFKRRNQRPFPTWTEVLGVLKSLGYSREPRKSA